MAWKAPETQDRDPPDQNSWSDFGRTAALAVFLCVPCRQRCDRTM